VPALIQHDSIIRHAVYALSAAHENYFGDRDGDRALLRSYGLHYQQKAIREATRLEVGAKHFDVLLSICLIFYSFASLQGRFEEATQHAVAGLRMIAGQPEWPGASALSKEVLLQIYLELRDQVCQANSEDFKIGGPELVNRLLVAPKASQTAENLLMQVQLLSFQVLDLFEVAETFHQTHPWMRGSVASPLLPAYENAIDKHAEITNALASLACTRQHAPTRKLTDAALALKVFLTSLHIDLQVFVHGEESYDDYLNDNVTILDHIQDLLCAQTHTQHPTPYISSLGIISLLFEIATRTTHMPLRDRALTILHSTNRREGIWDSRVAARLAGRLITLTEEGNSIAAANSGLPGSTTAAMTSTTHLPMSCNLSNGTANNTKFIITDIQLLSTRQAKVTYGFKRRWRATNHTSGLCPAESTTAFSAEEFHSFWLEGVGPGEGEVRVEIIEFD
jgi:hypothetical protein